jgi:hypothetical protein
MLTIEMAIQKIQQFPPEQRNQVIQFVEFLDFKSNQVAVPEPETQVDDSSQTFFEMAGLWEDKEITLESIRAEAWREGK